MIFNLLSPEAMEYYLDEIARVQAKQPKWDRPKIKFRSRPGSDTTALSILFRVSQRSTRPEDSVSTTYLGEDYSIGASSADDRSMHALSLVHQVLMLQNKGNDFPSTTNVRVIP